MHINLTPEMLPGLFVLACGTVVALFPDKLVRKKANAPTLKLMGVGLMIIGAILVFLP